MNKSIRWIRLCIWAIQLRLRYADMLGGYKAFCEEQAQAHYGEPLESIQAGWERMCCYLDGFVEGLTATTLPYWVRWSMRSLRRPS